ncbi:MAG: outer membrane protein assembly factor BamD [Gemmatimonadetes bacterium]|nr:outer membrane protein assembly factor BamD [Gemmatimonadota bacterium]
MRTRYAALCLLGAAACATPGQVRRVETQVAVMQRNQERADSARAAELARIIAMQTRAMDSLMAVTRTLDRVDRGSREQTAELLEARKQILAIQQRIDQSQQGLRELRAQLDARSEMAAAAISIGDTVVTTTPTTSPVTTPAPVAGAPSAAVLYANGQQSLRINAFGTARNAFRELLKAYPTSSYAPDAAFYIGDAFLREQRTDSAQVSFGRVVREFPASMRAAAALYKLGVMAQDRGDLAAARGYFQQVVSPRYRAADEYELAQDRLKTLPL